MIICLFQINNLKIDMLNITGTIDKSPNCKPRNPIKHTSPPDKTKQNKIQTKNHIAFCIHYNL